MSTAATPPPSGRAKFFGKYRGKVIENIDPLFQGRILADVPAVPGSLMNFALPCTPYAGMDVGFYAIPPVGANVWIEYEGGDENYPIWAGCFWGPEDILHVPLPPPPEMKVFKTEFVTMVLDDLPQVGGFSLKVNPLAVDIPLSMVFDSTGITILCPESTIKMTPASIELAVPEGTITITPALISIAVPESLIELVPAAISIAVPASSIEMTPELMEIEAPDISVTGIVEVEGLTSIMPALTVEGIANVTGLLTAEGDVNILGALEVEGEVNFAGALEVEGAVAIAGGLAILGGGTIDGAPIL